MQDLTMRWKAISGRGPSLRRRVRPLVAMALALLLAVPAVTGGPAAPAAATPSACSTAVEAFPSPGDGLTRDTAWQISTAGHLEQLRAHVVAGTATGKFYEGAAGGTVIDLGGCLWTPIGTGVKPFNGTFIGSGMTISGLNVVGSGDGDYGLFGVTRDAAIENLRVEGTVSITTGTAYAGGLIGLAEGSLDLALLQMAVDVSQSGNGSNSGIGGVVGRAGNSGPATVTARGVFVEGDVTSPADGAFSIFAGGLLGYLVQGSLTVQPVAELGPDVAAFALLGSGRVEARQRVGGLVGLASGTVTASRVRIEGPVATTQAAIVGGVIGYVDADVRLTDVEVSGDVTSSGGTAGGVIGYANPDELDVADVLVSGAVHSQSGGSGGIVADLEVASGGQAQVSDVVISGSVTSTNGQVGGVAGYLQPSGHVIIQDVTVTGEVSGNFAVGGAIGTAELYDDVTLRRITVTGDVLAVTSQAGGVVGLVAAGEADGPTVTLTVEDSAIGTASSSTTIEAAEGFVGGVAGEIGYDGYDGYGAALVLLRTVVRAPVVAGEAPAGCLAGQVGPSSTVTATDSFSRSTVTIGDVETPCEFPPDPEPEPEPELEPGQDPEWGPDADAVPVGASGGPSFVAPGGVTPTLPVGSGEWVQADGSSEPLAVSSPGVNQLRYVADGLQVTFTGGAGSDVSRGLVADQNGEVVCEVCVQLAAGQVIEVWMFSTPRLVAAHLTEDLPCQRFSVPVVAPLDGGGPVTAGAHTLQLALPTSNGMQAVNVGVTVGGPVPASVPAGEGPVPMPIGLLLAALVSAGGALIVGRRAVVAG